MTRLIDEIRDLSKLFGIGWMLENDSPKEDWVAKSKQLRDIIVGMYIGSKITGEAVDKVLEEINEEVEVREEDYPLTSGSKAD